jgi:two-component system chemotaxis sensor kinase CheA
MGGMEEYKDTFLSEARDHMDTLNETLLILEKDATDMENINRTFRAFHTLKGNGATMGYKKFSTLAHHLEDILDNVRNEKLKVSRKVMDVIFEGVDILDEGLSRIEEDDSENLEIDDITNKVEEILGAKEEAADVKIGGHAHFEESESDKVKEIQNKGDNVFRIILVFEKDNPLKAGKCLIIFRDIKSIAEIIKSYPPYEEVKLGKFGAEIELVVSTKKTKKEISDHLNQVSGLKKDYVLELDEKYEGHTPDESEVHDKKEKAKEEVAKKHTKSVVKQIQSVKVNMSKLDKLMNLIGELLIYNIRLQDISQKHNLTDLSVILKAIDRLTLELQDEIMEVRMVPIGNIFNRFPRMMRDLANKEKKKMDLEVLGSEIEFDRTVLDQIGDPLVHLLRNAVDHGIEGPEKRIEKGKPEKGLVRLVARREKNNAIIEISDDGDGIDPKAVKESCIRKGMISKEEASRMTDEQLQRLIFRPGTSTNKVITDVSGRGVGMDVVETKIKQLGGVVKLESAIGKGTKVILQLPLTLAIVTCLMVRVYNNIYAIPLNTIERTVDVYTKDIKTIQNHEVFVLRGNDIPLLWMHELLGDKRNSLEKYTVVIVNKDDSMIGLVVDEITSQQQILIKTLQDMVKGTKGVAGATILGNGNVSLILDIGSLLS